MGLTFEVDDSLTLRQVYEILYGGSRAQYVDGYATLQREVRRSKHIRVGSHRQLVSNTSADVAVRKVGHRWIVSRTELEAARTEARAAAEELAVIDAAYKARQLMAPSGTGLRTTGGGYRVTGDFHQRWLSAQRMPYENDVFWICNSCWQLATLEHHKPECHRCRDWSPCGRACTVSAVRCVPCETSLLL